MFSMPPPFTLSLSKGERGCFSAACKRHKCSSRMKPPRVYTLGILHFFGGICRRTLLHSSSFCGSATRIHPWAYARGPLQRRIKAQGSLPANRPLLLCPQGLNPLGSFSSCNFSAEHLLCFGIGLPAHC
jgi:hypothetical protein